MKHRDGHKEDRGKNIFFTFYETVYSSLPSIETSICKVDIALLNLIESILADEKAERITHVRGICLPIIFPLPEKTFFQEG